MERQVSRRQMLRFMGTAAAGAVLAACGAPPSQGGTNTGSATSAANAPEPTTAAQATAAQASGQKATTAPAASSGQKVTLTWLSQLPATAEVVAAFNQKHPDIEIKVETAEFRDLFAQNQVRLGSGSSNLDIVEVDAPVMASYGLRGWLAPLDGVIPAETMSSWLPALDQSSRYGNKLLTVPVWNSTLFLYYNNDLFGKAGITGPGPDERWTWEQVADAAQKLTQDSNNDGTPDVWGFQFEQYNRIYQLQPLPQGLGAPVIGDDGYTVKGIIDSPEWVKAFSWFQDLHTTLKVAPQGQIGVYDLFTTNKLAMTVAGPWNLGGFTESKVPFRAAPHPIWPGGKTLVPTDGWHLGVNAKGAHVAEAQEFVKFAGSVEAGKVWREVASGWPVHKTLLDEIAKDPNNQEWPNKTLAVAANEGQYAASRAVTPGFLEYEEILSDTFEDIRNGAEVQGALSDAAERIEAEMQKYRS